MLIKIHCAAQADYVVVSDLAAWANDRKLVLKYLGKKIDPKKLPPRCTSLVVFKQHGSGTKIGSVTQHNGEWVYIALPQYDDGKPISLKTHIQL